MTPVFAIVGASGVGKTTLIENLLTLLIDRELSVVTVKRTHHDLGGERHGSDSWRHRQRGASETVLWGDDFCTHFKPAFSLEELQGRIGEGRDLILIEGGKNLTCPKIELIHREPPISQEPDLVVNRDEIERVLSFVFAKAALRYHLISCNDPLYDKERELRNEVLLRPIGLPDHAWEMKDEKSLHLVATQAEEVLGCVLLWRADTAATDAQLLQMAVADECQGRGIGARLVEELCVRAAQRGLAEIWCHARANVQAFYARLGFEVTGEPFEEVGLKHFKMTRRL